ncbi:aldehyde dehydrogenase family protein [Streptomyces sp. NPDC004237]|uniref:aldehyde dehydrogenase family protein n=1 Tax=Streptomyces sp. NPDC004237 TaxID=3154455 RepID=UPI0033B72AF4
MKRYDSHYANGAWMPSTGTAVLPVTDPATDEVIAEVVSGSASDVDRAVAAAREAFPAWSATSAEERAAYLGAIAQGLVDRTEEIAITISREMGSPMWFSRMVQAGLPANSFAKAAEIVSTFAFESERHGARIVREPYGVVGAIAPWNYPLHQIALKVAYAIAAGNTVVVKPSETTPLNAIALAEIIDAAGLPPGVFNLVFGTGPEVGEAIAGHPGIDLVSFTGSTRAGRRVGELASATVKRVALELGGKSPNVVLDDADLTLAVPAALQAAWINSGQTCSALTRLIVPRSKLAEVETIAVEAAAAFTVGAPQEETTVLGPLSSRAQQERVLGFVRKGIDEGARVVLGGETEPDDTPGAYVRPTIFSDVTREMTIHREEIFGPVLAIEPYDTEEEAVELANDTIYGLAGGVWAATPERAREVARRIRAGQVSINEAEFNADAPFGGYKQSGVGREAGEFGLEEFLEIKAIIG